MSNEIWFEQIPEDHNFAIYRVTEGMLQAQSGRVFELEEQMCEQNKQINMFKAQILCNDESIVKLLRMLTTRSSRRISLPTERVETGQANIQVSSGCEN
ncbi:unnamed protein product [Calypogeia fissa]